MISRRSGSVAAIRLESPRQDDVMRLLGALDAYLESLYPPESNHILDIDTLCAPDIRFFVARRGGEAVGCGARSLPPRGIRGARTVRGVRARSAQSFLRKKHRPESKTAGFGMTTSWRVFVTLL